MSKQEVLKNELFQSVICYVRDNHAETIDKAYEYFWDGNSPDEFLKGTALELGFINFEDWLVFDYRTNEAKETFLDLYAKSTSGLTDECNNLICTLKDTVLSLYEVVSVSKEKRVLLKDLLQGGEFSLISKALTKGLKKGDIFATRLLPADKGYIMSGCVYPFSADKKETLLNYIDKQFGRYKRNVDPEGSKREFLKAYGDVINIAWMNLILNHLSELE